MNCNSCCGCFPPITTYNPSAADNFPTILQQVEYLKALLKKYPSQQWFITQEKVTEETKFLNKLSILSNGREPQGGDFILGNKENGTTLLFQYTGVITEYVNYNLIYVGVFTNQDLAEEALALADTAKSAAQVANINAQAADTKAQNAKSAAQAADTKAQGAGTKAQQALDLADTAKSAAQVANINAQAADTKAQGAGTKAQQALDLATTNETEIAKLKSQQEKVYRHRIYMTINSNVSPSAGSNGKIGSIGFEFFSSRAEKYTTVAEIQDFYDWITHSFDFATGNVIYNSDTHEQGLTTSVILGGTRGTNGSIEVRFFPTAHMTRGFIIYNDAAAAVKSLSDTVYEV